MNKTYINDFKPFSFRFYQSVERFFVEETPLYSHSKTKKGEWLLLKVKKQDLSTWRLISILQRATGASEREIGYAGLKDKSATAIQYFTIPRRYEKSLKNIQTNRIEILENGFCRSPLKIGELQSNHFRIFIDKITPSEAKRLIAKAKSFETLGIPNYFGYQRFGEDGKSWEQGKEIALSGKRIKGSRERLLVTAWQSYLFNQWLSSRVKYSQIISTQEQTQASQTLQWPIELIKNLKEQPQFFKLFHGDLLHKTSSKKHLFNSKNPLKDAQEFYKKRLNVTGLLPGSSVWRSRADARHLEAPFDDEELDTLSGDRRDAWIWPKDIKGEVVAQDNGLFLEFTLPAGSYATTLLEALRQCSLTPQDREYR